jgi:hypothetical protein
MLIKVKPVLKAKPKSYPENEKNFDKANRFASKKEKKKYPKGFKQLDKIDRSLPNDEILGHVNQKGDVSFSKKVPKNLRKEVAFHEKMERRRLSEKKTRRK